MDQVKEAFDFQRLRLVYARREALRYISHLDMQLVWERTLRRAGAPLAYSKGFNPNPRMHMAAALPLGFLSQCEIADIWLEVPSDARQDNLLHMVERIQEAAPPGLEIRQAEFVPLHLPALQTQVLSAVYTATSLESIDKIDIQHAIQILLSTTSLQRERRRKKYDLRPLIEELVLEQNEETLPVIQMKLSAREGATGRPEEVLAAIGLDAANFRIERTDLILQPASG